MKRAAWGIAIQDWKQIVVGIKSRCEIGGKTHADRDGRVATKFTYSHAITNPNPHSRRHITIQSNDDR